MRAPKCSSPQCRLSNSANSAIRTKSGDSCSSGLRPTETIGSAGSTRISLSLRCRRSRRSLALIFRKRNGVASPCKSKYTNPRSSAISCSARCRRKKLFPLPVFPSTTMCIVRRVLLSVTCHRVVCPSALRNPRSRLPRSDHAPRLCPRRRFQIAAMNCSRKRIILIELSGVTSQCW